MKKKMYLASVLLVAFTGMVMVTEFASCSKTATPADEFSVEMAEDGDGVVIKEYLGNRAKVKIPGTIEGIPVREIGEDAFWGNERLTSVTIPEGVKSIDFRAFAKCSSLASVIIPGSVTSIGSFAFADCSSLTSVTIPKGVTSIYSSTFAKCSSLASVIIPESVTFIGDSVFFMCSSLTSVTIPDSVIIIGGGSFSDCNNLVTVNIAPIAARLWFPEKQFYGCSKVNLASQAALKKAGYTDVF
jgi:hypothetical protein